MSEDKKASPKVKDLNSHAPSAKESEAVKGGAEPVGVRKPGPLSIEPINDLRSPTP